MRKVFSGFLLKTRPFCCIMLICGDIDNNIRKGEEMRLKKVHSAFIATVLTCSLAVTPVFADPTQSELEDQKANAQSELADLQAELNTIASKISELEDQLIETGEEIAQAEKDLAAAEEKKEEQYEAMKLRIKYMYESGSGTSTMEKVMQSGDISDMLSQAEYSQQVHEYDRAQLQEYANTVTEIEELQTKLEEEMESLKESEAEYENQQATLSSTIEDKKDEISNLDEMIQEAARKAEEERKAAEERARQERERQQQEANAANNEAQDNGSNSDDDSDSGSNSSGGSGSSGGSSNSGSSGGSSYNAATGNAIVDRAYSKLGCAYVWGATGPSTFDCSGLVGYAVTGSYSRVCTSSSLAGLPSVSNPQPGDICVKSGHCGIYIGNGMMIHAPTTGDVVKVAPVQSGMWYVRW